DEPMARAFPGSQQAGRCPRRAGVLTKGMFLNLTLCLCGNAQRKGAMNEEEWVASTEPNDMVFHLLRGKASERKLRLFACACCRRIWHRLSDERSRKAVEVA